MNPSPPPAPAPRRRHTPFVVSEPDPRAVFRVTDGPGWATGKPVLFDAAI